MPVIGMTAAIFQASKQRFKMEINILDQHLSRLRPEFYKNLLPPLQALEIQELEQQYQMNLPEDLKNLYSWKNGQSISSFDSFVNNSTFLSLQEALEIAAELTGMIGYDFEIENWWNRNWIPLFHNGGGDYICYDLEGLFTGNAGQLITFWHADADRDVIAPTLEEFLKAINRYYELTPVTSYDEFFEADEIEGYPIRFEV